MSAREDFSSAHTAPRRASFSHAVGAGFVLSLCGAAVLAVLGPVLGGGSALRIVIALLGLAYVLYLLGRSGERVGRVTAIACWLAAACVAWLAGLPLVAYVLVHVGLAWLVRSLYYYSGVLPALVDLGVSVLGTVFAVWAAHRTGSAWLAFWSFFLVQAFHTLIPASLAERAKEHAGAADDAFNRARRAAEAAIRRLSTAR